jgi:arginine N-succinyltransferase
MAELDFQPDQPLSLTPAMCAALNVTDGSPIRLIAL